MHRTDGLRAQQFDEEHAADSWEGEAPAEPRCRCAPIDNAARREPRPPTRVFARRRCFGNLASSQQEENRTMSRSSGGGARKPASKFPQLRKQMQKNAITKGLQQTKSHQPKPKGKKHP